MRNPDFMIVALPRCRTAWLANFLTTDATLCLHDPVGNAALGDELPDDGRMLGWSDTAIGMFPERVNAMGARVLVIERDPDVVVANVERLGIMGAGAAIREQHQRMKHINGYHLSFDSIDAELPEIWRFCTAGLQFDAHRAKMLKTFNIELTPAALARFTALLKEAA